MKTLTEFKASLNADQPGKGLSVQLKSLWYDAKGDWNMAVAQFELPIAKCERMDGLWAAWFTRKECSFG